jgi:hypothetical protein
MATGYRPLQDVVPLAPQPQGSPAVEVRDVGYVADVDLPPGEVALPIVHIDPKVHGSELLYSNVCSSRLAA